MNLETGEELEMGECKLWKGKNGGVEFNEEYNLSKIGRLFHRCGAALRNEPSENFSLEVSGGGQMKSQSVERLAERDRGVLRR